MLKSTLFLFLSLSFLLIGAPRAQTAGAIPESAPAADPAVKPAPAPAPAVTPEAAPAPTVTPPATPAPADPFAFGDFTWLNGNNRQSTALLDSKYITGSVMLDVNYSYSFNHPNDNTIVGSTVTGRHNEVNILMFSPGADFHYKGIRASMSLQFGSYATLVPRNDPSVNRGQYDLTTAFRYFREVWAGYHWDKLHGINLDAGIFMSYIGLFSYVSFENWAYQPSYVSDNTPFFFQGLRLQIFPTDRLQVEVWIINGWQSYAKFNELPGFGFHTVYRPRESISFSFNGYVGWDTQDHPGRLRFHSDNSFLARYYNRPSSSGLSRAALSFTGDLGFENGDGVTAFGGSGGPAQNFLGAMLYNRLWFMQNLLAFTLGGGFISNPGRYLVISPPGQTTTIGPFAQTTNFFPVEPGTYFRAWDTTGTFDYMPNDYITYRFEVVYRSTLRGLGYFAGPNGVTSPDGYTTTPVPTDGSWKPDLVPTEWRLILALLFRM